MSDEKTKKSDETPTGDGELAQELPEKTVTGRDAESVKGGAGGQHIKKTILF